MEGQTLARIGAAVFVGIAITATAIEMTRKEDAPAPRVLPRPVTDTADPLRVELARCGIIGEAALSDQTCLLAWAENRRRFLHPSSRSEEWAEEPSISEENPIRRETMPVEPSDEGR